ncbi:hypothetical protein [Pontibacter burrus]|uniref:Peptidase M10 metallopeptidase domain-containing protein n=1 Tax=Pontibacter burrus TaxID=2704466 RepID=A0A6B3M0I9_9BACT|nr:hypothetical protein [Pontibacter burrus]NEM99147.1 hypothetical protein [Pontibacter burrus]
MKYLKQILPVTLLATAAFSCQDQLEDTQMDAQPLAASTENLMQAELRHGNYAVLKAEYITAGEDNTLGNVVYFNNRGNKQLDAHFLQEYSEDGTTAITYYVDNNRPSLDVSAAISEAAIDRAMSTWDASTCSSLDITKIASDGRATGFVAALLGLRGSYNYVADIVHAGWLPAAFFNAIAPNGAQSILGVTFTIIYLDENGNESDIDGNGKADVAFREIYYNDRFLWNDGSTYDIETIALHEAGHGLSQGHFGKAFATVSNNKLHFSPRSVMNAAYSGVQTTITATDNGGHCSIWASWK